VIKANTQPTSTCETILRAGQIIDGKYRVDHLLGQGGMAAVWAGTNERTGKRVALKVILQSLATTRQAQQLLHSEALAASRVNHPNVVTVFDVIEHEGMTCIVMELLNGEPLASYVARNGFISLDEVRTLLLPAMRGVAAAHAQGVIHRDLKPQNIFICVEPDGRIVTTKVLDFGISVMVGRVLDLGAEPAPGPMVGTPAYMSPEHLSGVARLDERADVYGFGVLLYESLTGQSPFPGEPGPALFGRIVNQPAPPVTLFRPDLPPGVVHIIEKAMAKQRDRRYSGVNSMVSALEDELAPATPPPRLLTPVPGVPAVFSHQPPPAQSEPAVQVIINQEPSGQHQETKFLFGAPLEQKRAESARDAEVNEASKGGSQPESAPNWAVNGVSNDGWEESTSLPHIDRATAVVHRRLADPSESFGPASLSPLRGWRGFAAGGIAVALGLVVWMAMRDARPGQPAAPVPVANLTPPMSESNLTPASVSNLKPPASESPAPQAVPVVLPIAELAATAEPAALPAPPLPPALATLATATHSKLTSHARALRAHAIPSRTRVALREVSTAFPLRRQSHAVSQRLEPAEMELPAPSDRAATKPATPRAGRLSRDDF
jgi:serine/threonine-protein kinase